MAKKARRAVPADIWLDRATEAQKEKMRKGLGVTAALERVADGLAKHEAETPLPQNVTPTIRVHDLAKPEGERETTWPELDFNAETAYAIQSVPVAGGVLSYRLLKLKIAGGVITDIEAGLESLRGVILQQIEDHILRDA
jgi:hypothetical protein